MKPFKNAFDFDQDIHLMGELNEKESMTVPDQTMSLHELLKRYTRGAELPTLPPVFQEDDEFSEDPEFEKMDATEKLQAALDLKLAIKRHQNTPPQPVKKEEPPVELAKPAEDPKPVPEEPEQ